MAGRGEFDTHQSDDTYSGQKGPKGQKGEKGKKSLCCQEPVRHAGREDA